ncbi:MAG: hypothetical protein IK093_16200 [Ruminiclostridium sp.]|nr:hypothetical protein [Ruminiclostridium sp.]
MKKNFCLLFTAVLLVCCFFAAGCSSGYTSSYKAVGFVHTETDELGSMSFAEFEGVKVFELKFKDSFDKSLLYTLKLETGSATIYYDTNGDKVKLTSVKAGDKIDDKLKDLKCETMYIIVETNEKCLNGSFEFKAKTL